MKTTYWQKYATITASVPTELKVDLIERAKMLGISLNELMNKVLFEEDCKVFDEQVSQLKAENEALQNRIIELEANDTEAEIKPCPCEDENEDNERASKLEDFAQRLNESYCELKQFAFDSFAMAYLYKSADADINENLRTDVLPAIKKMKAKGLENIADFFISQSKNTERINKQKLLSDIEAKFDDAYQIENALSPIQTLSPKDIKDIYLSLKNEIFRDFQSKIDDIEIGIYRLRDFELFTSCEIEQIEVEELQAKLYDDLSQDVNLQEYAETTFKEEQEAKVLQEKAPEPIALEAAAPKEKYTPKSKEEKILHELYQKKVDYITIQELRALGFSVGFFSKLTIRGATYGAYKLEKAPSEKVFKLLQVDATKNSK